MQKVAILADGFAWTGRTYRSLSKVAQAITGTRWNGRMSITMEVAFCVETLEEDPRHVWPQGHHFDGCSAGRHRPAPELKPVTQGLPQRASLTYSPRVVTTGEKRGVSTMSQSAFETSEQVLKFDPKAKGRSDVTPLDDAGQAIVAQIRTAADLANQDCDRAMSLAHKLSMELRAAEDRTHQLLAEVELWRNRATRAEEWLRTIQKEIEDKLIVRRPLSGIEETILHR